jgi:hypothetical protein
MIAWIFDRNHRVRIPLVLAGLSPAIGAVILSMIASAG